MSTPNPLLTAAAPELIAVIKALQAFNAAMGPDPTKWALNYPGAQLILTGTVLNQLPLLATAEGGVAVTQLDSIYAGWITKLSAPA
jgi:hypothetical protein